MTDWKIHDGVSTPKELSSNDLVQVEYGSGATEVLAAEDVDWRKHGGYCSVYDVCKWRLADDL